ncbi:hypothetical protein I6F26_03515 [Ensifer sp. IC3342]|nr:hypothetical protein [Ensifer sp. BRP08]MCA1445661.1 hypothetical protein [Ensifer sp. IC3342]
MPNAPVQAAAEGLPQTKLIEIADRLSEADDFCQAIFMAAFGLEDRDDTAVFQRLADIAKGKVGRARALVDEIRGEVHQ